MGAGAGTGGAAGAAGGTGGSSGAGTGATGGVGGTGGAGGSSGSGGTGGTGACTPSTQLLCGLEGDAASASVVCYQSTATGSFDNAKFADLTLGNGWDDEEYHLTIDLADVTGDGRADLCARSAEGIVCSENNGAGFDALATWSTTFSDTNGWDDDDNWATIQYPDVNGDGRADVCGRSDGGVYCRTSTGSGFTTELFSVGGNFSDAEGWDARSWWATIQFVDVNGDGMDDVCGRRADGSAMEAGVRCSLSTGTGFAASTLWSGLFDDADGWDATDQWATLQFPDINGDGKADICGRSDVQLSCALSDGTQFGSVDAWSIFYGNTSIDGSWDEDVSRWGTIQFPDINGDGNADVCGRRNSGIFCAVSNGTDGFESPHLWTAEYADPDWEDDSHWATLAFPDINGDGNADVCGRDDDGMRCALSNGVDGFESSNVWGQDFDNSGFDWSQEEMNYRTIQFGTGFAGDCGTNASYALPWRTGALPPRNPMRGG